MLVGNIMVMSFVSYVMYLLLQTTNINVISKTNVQSCSYQSCFLGATGCSTALVIYSNYLNNGPEKDISCS